MERLDLAEQLMQRAESARSSSIDVRSPRPGRNFVPYGRVLSSPGTHFDIAISLYDPKRLVAAAFGFMD